MGKIARSWALTKESWSVLRQDKTLVIFPIMSTGAVLLIVASFAAPFLALLPESHGAPNRAVSTVLGLAFYFCTFTVMNFFNVALVGAAMERFAGRETGVKIGLGIAMKRLPQILAWSAFATTVGMVLRIIEDQLGFVGRFVVWLVGMAWAIAIFFVVPVLAAEGVGPVDAVKRSASVIKKTWGEAALTRIGVSAVFMLIIIPVILVGTVLTVVFALKFGAAAAIAIGAVSLFVLVGITLISTTLDAILQAALYRYAVDGVPPTGFEPATLSNIFTPKK